MENFRRETLENSTNKIEKELVNYLVDNTLDIMIDVLENKDANYLEAHEHLYKRYLCINAFVENGKNQETLAVLLTIYRTIPLSDLFKDRNKLVLLNLVLSILDTLSTEYLEKIESYLKSVDNTNDKGNLELIGKTRDKIKRIMGC